MKWYNRPYWFICELIKTLSDNPSYFSKARIQGYIAFIVLEYGCYDWIQRLDTMPMDINSIIGYSSWVTAQGAVAGFVIPSLHKNDLKP
jgi:hypothetical protein